MSRLLAPAEDLAPVDARPLVVPGAPSTEPTIVSVRALQREVADLRREVEALRLQRRRDLATARGLGEALQALRRGAMALRTENEELRREAAGRAARRR